jgi:EAL domain-containing protein (putative c-di-GMP-specific phosphodiesterase class I)
LIDPIIPYHGHSSELATDLAERGSLGLVVIDASSLGIIEHEYGTEAFEQVRNRFLTILGEQRGKDYRNTDVVALDEPQGLRFILFLERKRRRSLPFTPADLKSVRARLAASLIPALSRATFPYLKSPPRIDLGHGLALHNPIVHPERILGKAFRKALILGAHQRKAEELQSLERLQDLILRERVVTAYQPIMVLKDRTLLGCEALSRGGRGTGFETADELFRAAAEQELLVELDRLCRSRALLASARVPSSARIFVNTLPATIRDPQFRGKPLIDFLARAQVSPERIVIEITEKLVIENYGLFREAMAYFTDLGMSFAVDDVGAGYSGLESIAKLKPHFLKIDITLVRDVHVSLVNRAMVKAIVSIGHGIGATVIAEGIHSEEEIRALLDMGVGYGQGYYLARPDPGPEPA